ncbi:MAG: HlyD family type I secretion periplasmic adaptor subunit [Proteobacteria bacterium]|nr:HlyD family type I secretion periplasmic adaptor subunit [Pseudomonadota bacterium]
MITKNKNSKDLKRVGSEDAFTTTQKSNDIIESNNEKDLLSKEISIIEGDKEGGAPLEIKGDKELDKIHSVVKFFRNASFILFSKEINTTVAPIQKDLYEQIKPAVMFGATTIFSFIFIFFIWGGLAPLDSAVIAQGSLVVMGSKQTVQNADNGVIEEIFIEEGQQIEEGQPLIRLNDTRAKAGKSIVLSKLRFAKALEARLLAENAEEKEVRFDDPILNVDDAEVAVLIQNQRSLFELNMSSLSGAINIYDQRIIQKKSEIAIYEAKLKAVEARLELIKEQLNIAERLHRKGLGTKEKLLHSQERYQDLEGEMHSNKSQIARVREEIQEAELTKLNARNEFRQKSAERYRENHEVVLNLEQELDAAEDTLRRTIIRSPKKGIVTGLNYHTVGGVVQSGAPVMQIVPLDEKLIVEANLLSQHIESIYVGLNTKVQLDAYKSRLVPRISGKVIYVAADSMVHEQSGMAFYKIKVELDQDSIDNINSDIKLHAGMPATVFVVKGVRTFLQYMISPITDSFHRALKET